MKKYFIFLWTLVFMLAACHNDDNDVVVNELPEEQEEPKTVADYPVQDFMWQTMNAYYFWQQDVALLADDRFTGPEDPDYISFLGSYNGREQFFYNICNKHKELVGETAAIDRFSYTTSNYKELVQVFSGISKSNGLEFSLGLYDSNSIFGVVDYVVQGSDASRKNIKRGDFFIGIDGQYLTLDNYITLLFGENDTYTLNMANVSGNEIAPNNIEITLTKEENLVENPILISKVLEVSGQKVGYLMYNSFVADFDDELNEKFGEFAAAGITDLILDLRYNGGGRVSSAIQIASSIYGTRTDELFLRARYNDKLQAGLPQSFLDEHFVDRTYDSEIPINALGLSRVFVIATDRTASASELVMNGLAPYVQVIHVGSTTVGKNEFSNTFVDDPENDNFYDPLRESYINPNNQWAIQPLMGRNENADGFSDYTNGLAPDYELEEDITNLGVLGDPSEPLLQKTLDLIGGGTGRHNYDPVWTLDYVGDSKMFSPAKNTMLMDGLLKPSVSNRP